MGRSDGRPAGAADVAGAAQARRQPQPGQHRLPVHEPDPREDRRQLRQPGDAAGRPGDEVLRLPAARPAPDRDPQGGHRGGRQPGPRQGRQEQGRGAVPPGRVRRRVRRRASRTRAACSTSASSTTSSRSRARSSPTGTSASARARTTRRRSCPRTSRSRTRSRTRSTRRSTWSGSRARSRCRSSARPRREAAEATPRPRRTARLRRRRRPPRPSSRCPAMAGPPASLRSRSTPRCARCNRREHSIAEIEAKLAERGFGREEIEERDRRAGATRRARRRPLRPRLRGRQARARRLGPGADRGALAERGVSEELIEECCGGEDREELIERASEALLQRGDTLDDDGGRSRALGFLTRRGYEYEVAYDAIRAASRAASG